jgi:hypothetical protein
MITNLGTDAKWGWLSLGSFQDFTLAMSNTPFKHG